MSRLLLTGVILVASAAWAAGGDQGQIVDLTDTIRVGLVEQTAGDGLLRFSSSVPPAFKK